jgi:hypothetical protein
MAEEDANNDKNGELLRLQLDMKDKELNIRLKELELKSRELALQEKKLDSEIRFKTVELAFQAHELDEKYDNPSFLSKLGKKIKSIFK